MKLVFKQRATTGNFDPCRSVNAAAPEHLLLVFHKIQLKILSGNKTKISSSFACPSSVAKKEDSNMCTELICFL